MPDPGPTNQPVATTSNVLLVERAVRDAFTAGSRRRHLRRLWRHSDLLEKALFALGFAAGGYSVVANAAWSQAPDGILALLLPAAIVIAWTAVRVERKAYRDEFATYGARTLNRRIDEPSALRYLSFLDHLAKHPRIDGHAIRTLIPAIEARLTYRQSIFAQRPVLTLITAMIAMLAAGGLGHAMVWDSGAGPAMLFVLTLLWFVAWRFGRDWRALNPSREARERELLVFLHQAAADLDANSHDRAAESEALPPESDP